MQQKKNNKIFDFKSNDEIINKLIVDMKSNSKVYTRLTSALQLLGTFDGKTEVEVYDNIDNGNESKIRLWCSDIMGNLFIFYANSSTRSDLLKITKETNDSTYEYDILLAKKFPINSDNINFTRTGYITGVKYGRFISNDRDFYSLFMGDNVGYQIQGDFDMSLSDQFIKKINSLNTIPTLAEFMKAFEEILNINNCKFTKMQIGTFKNFEKVGQFTIDDNLNNKKQKALTKTK